MNQTALKKKYKKLEQREVCNDISIQKSISLALSRALQFIKYWVKCQILFSTAAFRIRKKNPEQTLIKN